jgi:hypothetical protein
VGERNTITVDSGEISTGSGFNRVMKIPRLNKITELGASKKAVAVRE